MLMTNYTICTEMVTLNTKVAPSAEWRVVQYSCSNFSHKLLDTERYVTSNTLRMEKPNIGHRSDFCLHAASCNQMSAIFMSLTTHSST